MPLQAPPQPVNTTLRLEGLAVSVTVLPLENVAEHFVPQLMPLGLLITLPEPLLTTFRAYARVPALAPARRSPSPSRWPSA